jgi:hypothetical protein
MREEFIVRVEQAALLLSRLNDEDIADERARRVLRVLDRSELDTCLQLFFAWCSIAITAKKIADIGYELAPVWEERLTSAYEHIMDLCVCQLDPSDFAIFERNYGTIFSNALHLNPYVAIPGYIEDLDLSEER